MANSRKYSDHFNTKLPISKEEFIRQLEQFIEVEETSFLKPVDLNPSYFTGDINANGFNVKKRFYFDRFRYCVVNCEGQFSKKGEALNITSRLTVEKARDNKSLAKTIFIIIITLILIILAIVYTYILTSPNPRTDALLAPLGFLAAFIFISYMNRNAKKRGLEKMKQELKQTFELIELRSLKNRKA